MDQQKLRLYQLEKQNLFTKEKQTNYHKILNNHIGLHSTDYLTPYIALWSRVENFDPKNLFDDINNKEAIRLRAMRRTVFVSHKDNLPVLIPTISEVLTPYKIDNIKHLVTKMGMPEDFPEKISRDIISMLKEKDALTTSQIKKELLGKYNGDFVRAIITLLEFECKITRVGQRYITDKTINWGLFSKHYPKITANTLVSEKAFETIFLKYLEQFGPICLDDFCWWLPMKKTQAKEIISNCQNKIVEFDFLEKKYYMLKDDFQKYESFNAQADEPIVNFLPYEDHFPKAYKIRDWHISKEVTVKLYEQGKMAWGQIRPSIWLNGEIKGRWEMNWLDAKKTKAEIILKYLHNDLKDNKKIMNLVEDEQKLLEEFFNEQLIPIMKRQ
ncbi:MAG: DNA glycosylase AlkZ-like family protein [Candidatus Heimdallarchaeota archaeon]